MQGEINDLQTHMYYQKKGFDNLAEQNSYEQVALTGIGEYCFINSTVSKYEGKETGYSLNLILTPEAEGTVREVANRILDAAQNPNWEYSQFGFCAASKIRFATSLTVPSASGVRMRFNEYPVSLPSYLETVELMKQYSPIPVSATCS